MASVDELRARIRRYNGGLDPSGETFGAALILIAACEYGQNVDLLARRTGLPRAFVARCARRLTDNGVWVGGKTAAEWAPEDPASGNFWSDAAVAEGKMCRRARPDGSLEWAPAVFRNKNFHFLDPDAEDRPGNLYFDSTPPLAPTPVELEDDATPESDAEPELEDAQADPSNHPSKGLAKPFELEEPSAEPFARPPEPGAPGGPEREEHDAVPPLHHVFRDAVWIG
jgi:hypothetical protein